MFTWICPKCGREVGPSYNECPFCAQTGPSQPLPPVPVTVAPPQPQYVPPAPPQPQYVPPPPPQAPDPLPPAPPAQQIYYVGADDHKRSIPGWLAAILAFAAVGLVAWGVISYSRSSRNAPTPAAAAAAKQKAAGNPYAKFLELTGFRINEANKKLQVQFLAVNHGAADLSDIEGVITLKVKGAEADEPACTFKFTISAVPAYGAKEVVVTSFMQKRKSLDMPDWLFLEPVVEFTSTP